MNNTKLALLSNCTYFFGSGRDITNTENSDIQNSFSQPLIRTGLSRQRWSKENVPEIGWEGGRGEA